MKYVHYEANTGKILGWYSPEVHGKKVVQKGKPSIDMSVIPSPNIEISDEAWQQALAIGANKIDAKSKNFMREDTRTQIELLQIDEDKMWEEYKRAKEQHEKLAWIAAGKPIFKKD